VSGDGASAHIRIHYNEHNALAISIRAVPLSPPHLEPVNAAFTIVALTDLRMERYPVFRDATGGEEKFAIKVRDDHHLNRHVNDCGCPCRQT
jgi:hypothetical protein